MDYFSKLSRRITLYIFAGGVSIAVITIGAGWAIVNYTNAEIIYGMITASIIGTGLLFALARTASSYTTEPLKALSQAILHVTPGEHGVSAPNLDRIKVGRELVTNLSLQVYQIASRNDGLGITAITKKEGQAQTILDELPVPVIVTNKNQSIMYANHAAGDYLGKDISSLIGQSLYSVLDLSFSNEETLDSWLAQSRSNTVTASNHWDRVRLTLGDKQTRKQLDLAAYYNKNNPNGAEVALALFDKTKFYSQDDDSISFIALAVHELRTPLTILRGYIEVFEDEVADNLDPEMQDFMRKMQASAQQLSSFVSNILNVAKIEENQLFLQLHEEDWSTLLPAMLDEMQLRARVHGKNIKYEIQTDLPTAAVDRTSVYEVINNLVENAIKYSVDSDQILVKTYLNDDDMIETTVQDFGIGIPDSIIGNLFQKFYRNHRSRAQFGGTGLGLYLSKAIVDAHGGQIWVRSKEGQGSTFGFTLQPYLQLAKKEGTKDNKNIVRTAHGWIKNHSFYRR